MNLTISCPDCQRPLRVPDNLLGQAVKCPGCAHVFTMPAQVEKEVPQRHSKRRARDEDNEESCDEEPRQSPHAEKHCVECGARIRVRAVVCPECGVSQTDSSPRAKKHCFECGAVIRGNAAVCPKCGVEQAQWGTVAYRNGNQDDIRQAASKKIAAGIFGILLGALGIHKFILGLTTPAVIMLVVSLVGSCLYGLGFFVMWVIGLVEGIIYLTKSDEDFYRTYIVGKKEWF